MSHTSVAPHTFDNSEGGSFASSDFMPTEKLNNIKRFINHLEREIELTQKNTIIDEVEKVKQINIITIKKEVALKDYYEEKKQCIVEYNDKIEKMKDDFKMASISENFFTFIKKIKNFELAWYINYIVLRDIDKRDNDGKRLYSTNIFYETFGVPVYAIEKEDEKGFLIPLSFNFEGTLELTDYINNHFSDQFIASNSIEQIEKLILPYHYFAF